MMTLTAYFPAVRGEFIWDDDLYAANPILEQPGGLQKIWTLRHPEDQYYKEFPVVYTTFWLERRLWGLRPAGYHLVNIFLHIFNALLVWVLLKRLKIKWAWMAAAIFALHPVHVESVAWITERKNVLSGMFYLLALGGYLRFEDGRRRGWYAGSLVLFALALMSKSVTCTLPAVLLLLRWQRGMKTESRDLAGLLPFFLLSIGAGIFTLAVEQHPLDPQAYPPLAQRILAAGRALWFYPAKLLWPADLAFSYERWNLDTNNLPQWLWTLAALGTGILIWKTRNRLGRNLTGGLAFYAITISPVIGLVGIYTFRYAFVADHYQYLSSIGLIAAGTGVAGSLFGRLDSRRFPGIRSLKIFSGAAVLALLACLTWRQAGIYRDSDRIWTDTLEKNPSSCLAHNNLGLSLAAQGRTGEARAHYEAVLKLDPAYAEAYCNLGVLAAPADVEKAIGLYRAALRINPYFEKAHYNLGSALFSQGKTDEAVAHYKEAVNLKPDRAESHNDLGLALAVQGKTGEAAAQFKEALRLKPDFAKAYNNWGMALANAGRLEEAEPYFREAVRLDPGYGTARKNLATLLSLKSKK